MRRVFALALAAGIAAASLAVSPTKAVTVPIEQDFGSFAVGSIQAFAKNVTATGAGSGAYTFSIGATAPSQASAVVVDYSGEDIYAGGLKIVPVPAALPLFLTALAGIGLIARRRAKVQLVAIK
jgi:hypothetical protein